MCWHPRPVAEVVVVAATSVYIRGAVNQSKASELPARQAGETATASATTSGGASHEGEQSINSAEAIRGL